MHAAKKYKLVFLLLLLLLYRLCGLVIRVPGFGSEVPGSIPGATRFYEKQWVWKGVHLVNISEELL
jgi:hypothetical protein